MVAACGDQDTPKAPQLGLRKKGFTFMSAWCFVTHWRPDGRTSTHLLLALVLWQLKTHPGRDGAQFLSLVETAPAFGGSVHFYHVLHEEKLPTRAEGSRRGVSLCLSRCPSAVNIGFVFELTWRYLRTGERGAGKAFQRISRCAL